MLYFLGFGLLLFLILFIVGLIKPRLIIHWGKKNRIRVIKFYAPPLIIFCILFTIFSPSKQASAPIPTSNQEQTTSKNELNLPQNPSAGTKQQPTATEKNEEKPTQPSDKNINQKENPSRQAFDTIMTGYSYTSSSYKNIIYNVQNNKISRNEAIKQLGDLRTQSQLYSKQALFCDYDDEKSRSHLNEAFSYLTHSIYEYQDYLMGSQLQLDGAKDDLDEAGKEFSQINNKP